MLYLDKIDSLQPERAYSRFRERGPPKALRGFAPHVLESARTLSHELGYAGAME